jgi:ADP-heptose:LPS heptosyltransferase
LKILLTRTDRIGDLILSTPAIATVRASFPDAHIALVTSRYNRIAVERNTDVDELVSLPHEVNSASFGSRFRGYDVAVALAPLAADVQLVGGSKAPVRVGYTYVRRWIARATARLWLNRIMVSPADPELSDRDPRRVVPHEVDQLLDLVALAGAKERVSALRLDVTDEDRAAVAHLPDGPVVLHLGRRWFADGSSLASTLQLADELAALGRPFAISCAAECAEFAHLFEARGHVVASALPFHQWVAFFERACCVVTVDTGATHVASAMRRPTLVVFEHRYFRLNSQEWAPYGVPSVLVQKPASDGESALAGLRAHIVAGVRQLINA